MDRLATLSYVHMTKNALGMRQTTASAQVQVLGAQTSGSSLANQPISFGKQILDSSPDIQRTWVSNNVLHHKGLLAWQQSKAKS